MPPPIAAYAAAPTLVRAAFAGLTPAQLDARPADGSWTLRQIAVHLLESDLAATHRMRRIAAEATPPLIIAYDESALAANLSYDQDDLALVLDLFELNRRFTAAWLARVPESQFSRHGIHNQRGRVTLAEMVVMYVEHVDHHLRHAKKKRDAVTR
jgi:uncharacterized damage-inducible protein DinB